MKTKQKTKDKVTALRVTWAGILNRFEQESFSFEQESFSEEMTIRKGLSKMKDTVKKYLVDYIDSEKDYKKYITFFITWLAHSK